MFREGRVEVNAAARESLVQILYLLEDGQFELTRVDKYPKRSRARGLHIQDGICGRKARLGYLAL